MNHITMHGSLTVNGRTVIVHVGDGEANATVDGTHFNVRVFRQVGVSCLVMYFFRV